MFCDHSHFVRATTQAGQDVFLEYRRPAKSSWSGSARHPKACYFFAIFLLLFCYPFAISQTFRAAVCYPFATFLLSDCYPSLFALHKQGTLAMYTSPCRKGAPSESRSSLCGVHPGYIAPCARVIPCLTAWPTPHGRTVNCAPVHRYQGGS